MHQYRTKEQLTPPEQQKQLRSPVSFDRSAHRKKSSLRLPSSSEAREKTPRSHLLPLTVASSMLFRELTVLPAIEEVNRQANCQPDNKAEPGNHSKPRHQSAAETHRNQREPGHQRNEKGPRTLGLLPSKENDPQRNQHKRKQRPNIRQVGGVADIDQSSRNSDREARNPCRPVWRFKFGVDCGEQLGQKSITRHGIPDSCLAVLKNEDR